MKYHQCTNHRNVCHLLRGKIASKDIVHPPMTLAIWAYSFFHINRSYQPSQQQWWICRGWKILLQNGPHKSPDLGYVDLLDLQRNWIMIITHNLVFSLFSPAAKKIGAKRRSRRLKAGLETKDANISRRPTLNNRHWEPFKEDKW